MKVEGERVGVCAPSPRQPSIAVVHSTDSRGAAASAYVPCRPARAEGCELIAAAARLLTLCKRVGSACL